MPTINKDKLREFIKEQGPKGMADVNQFIKDLMGETIIDIIDK